MSGGGGGPSNQDVRRSGNESFAELDEAIRRASDDIARFANAAENAGLGRFREEFERNKRITGQTLPEFRDQTRQDYQAAVDRDRAEGAATLYNPDYSPITNQIGNLASSLSGADSLLGGTTLPQNENYLNLNADLARRNPDALRSTIAGTRAGSIPLSQQDIGYIAQINTQAGLENYGDYEKPFLDARDVETAIGPIAGSQFQPGEYQDSYFGEGAKKKIDPRRGNLGNVTFYNVGKQGNLGKEKDYKVGKGDPDKVFTEKAQTIGRQKEGKNINAKPTFVGQHADKTNIQKLYDAKQTGIALEGEGNFSANPLIAGRGARDYSDQIAAIGQQPGLNLDQRVDVGTRREDQGQGFAPGTVGSYNIGGSELKGTDAYTRDYGIGQGPTYDVNVAGAYGVGGKREGQGEGLTRDFGVGQQAGANLEAGFNADYNIGAQEIAQADRQFDKDYGVGTSARGRQGFTEAERIANQVGSFGRLAGGFRENFGIGQQADPGIFKKNERQLGRIAGSKFLA